MMEVCFLIHKQPSPWNENFPIWCIICISLQHALSIVFYAGPFNTGKTDLLGAKSEKRPMGRSRYRPMV